MSEKDDLIFHPDNDYYYVDVDCLYDVRLILLSLLDEKCAQDLLENEEYFKRQIDAFPGIGAEEFKTLYSQRGENPELLRSAPNTNFHLALHAIIRQSISIGRKGGVYRPVTLVLNTYPYQLEDEEISQLRGVLAEHMADTVDVASIFKSPKELDLEYCFTHFQYMAIYDVASWVKLHQKQLETKKYKELFVSTPALYYDALPPVDVQEKIKKDSKFDPFALTEIALATAISLQFLPIDYFCIFNEHKKISKLSDEDKKILFTVCKDVQDLVDGKDGISDTETEAPVS